MWQTLIDALKDAGMDSLKLIPFLFLTYLVMEYIEHKMGEKSRQTIQKSGGAGPIVGGLLGVVPQCGFSTVASNLYAGRIITVGTLLAVFLSTSDEMLPIFISEAVPLPTVIKILGIKCLIAIVAGVLVDCVVRLLWKKPAENRMKDLCEQEHCHCEKGIFRSAFVHTGKITLFLFLVSFGLNLVICTVGEDALKHFIGGQPVVASFLAGLVGLIPNCAASVVITELYLEQVISVGAMFSGLLVSAGVGLLVLFRVNDNLKENLGILATLYGIGVGAGIVLEFVFEILNFVL
ncbi:MAG: putative manganese transporter [Lachnospiraceae bacterium]|nr:putative manganese transporter [Lachnospiraceae bacterium]